MTAPLFYVDNMPYTQPDCDQIVQCLEERPEFQEPAGCRFAVCLQDIAHWLAPCLWLAPGRRVLDFSPVGRAGWFNL